jgi:hypothetical protein
MNYKDPFGIRVETIVAVVVKNLRQEQEPEGKSGGQGNNSG